MERGGSFFPSESEDRNYSSRSRAENCIKDQYTLIERSNTLIEQLSSLKRVPKMGPKTKKNLFWWESNPGLKNVKYCTCLNTASILTHDK